MHAPLSFGPAENEAVQSQATLGDEEEAQISQRRIALLALRTELERIAGGRAAG